jgi:deoxyribose-phosphate aldolase
MNIDIEVARRALALLDLTNLGDHVTSDDIDRLCGRATGPHGNVAAVCVWPAGVAQATRRLAGSGVAVAAVVNFPHGGDDVAAVVAETQRALGDGATEVDMVLPYRSFLSGNVDGAAAMIDAVRAEVTAGRRIKVILETGCFPSVASMHDAARLAIEHGADFVKTSTGKTSVSATDEAVVAILEEIRSCGRSVGIKPSGGISTLGDARRFLDHADRVMGPAWATTATFRFGASGLLDVLEATISGASTPTAQHAY